MMLLLLAASLLVTVHADVRGANVQKGDCVCANTNVNGREKPNETIIITLKEGACGTYLGSNQVVGSYTWFQVKYGSDIVWVAGRYLDVPSTPRCSTVSGGSCPPEQQDMACKLLEKARANVLQLAHVHPSGVSDAAYSWNNVEDMCNGGMAARSNYSCDVCTTGIPGGYTCLTKNLMSYLQNLADTGTVIVNELAGACHSCTSRHYNGQAVDLHNDERSQEYMDKCVAMGGWALDEHNHIHCQFYD